MAAKDLEKYYKVLDRYILKCERLCVCSSVLYSEVVSLSQSHHEIPQAEDGGDQ